jgi:hypothetical protein
MPGKDESILDTITHLKRQDPFVPFRIVMASGDRYLIENPDALAIATSQLHYYPSSGMGVHLRLNQIAAVEVDAERRRSRRRAG